MTIIFIPPKRNFSSEKEKHKSFIDAFKKNKGMYLICSIFIVILATACSMIAFGQLSAINKGNYKLVSIDNIRYIYGSSPGWKTELTFSYIDEHVQKIDQITVFMKLENLKKGDKINLIYSESGYFVYPNKTLPYIKLLLSTFLFLMGILVYPLQKSRYKKLLKKYPEFS